MNEVSVHRFFGTYLEVLTQERSRMDGWKPIVEQIQDEETMRHIKRLLYSTYRISCAFPEIYNCPGLERSFNGINLGPHFDALDYDSFFKKLTIYYSSGADGLEARVSAVFEPRFNNKILAFCIRMNLPDLNKLENFKGAEEKTIVQQNNIKETFKTTTRLILRMQSIEVPPQYDKVLENLINQSGIDIPYETFYGENNVTLYKKQIPLDFYTSFGQPELQRNIWLELNAIPECQFYMYIRQARDKLKAVNVNVAM